MMVANSFEQRLQRGVGTEMSNGYKRWRLQTTWNDNRGFKRQQWQATISLAPFLAEAPNNDDEQL